MIHEVKVGNVYMGGGSTIFMVVVLPDQCISLAGNHWGDDKTFKIGDIIIRVNTGQYKYLFNLRDLIERNRHGE